MTSGPLNSVSSHPRQQAGSSPPCEAPIDQAKPSEEAPPGEEVLPVEQARPGEVTPPPPTTYHDTTTVGEGRGEPADGPALTPGNVVGDCTIESVIGEGGSSMVYLARQRGLDRRVAIKVLRTPAGSRESRWRFTLEARVLGGLDHPCIARVFGSGVTEDGRPYLLMEYIDGSPITEGAAGLSPREKVRLFLDVCDAVQAAHRSGVIHRDIKPTNVLVERGRASAGRRGPGVKLLDFGIARVMQANAPQIGPHTHAGMLLGTAAYMSPEQAAGLHDEVGTTSDVFSLGVVLFELLAGRAPRACFGGPGSARLPLDEQLRRLRTEPAPALSRFDRSLRGDLDTIVARALELSPARRYQSPGEFRDDLERWLEQRPIEARRPGAWYRARLWVKRNRAATAAIVSIAGAAAFGGVMAARAWAVEQREHQSALAHYSLLLDEVVDEAAKRAATREFRLNILEAASSGIEADLERRPDDPRLLAMSAQATAGLASIRIEQTRYSDAMRLQERALRLRERVCAVNPQSRAARLERSIQVVRVGDIAGRTDPARRLRLYEEAHAELLKLCDEDPADPRTLESLTWSYERLGFLAEIDRGSAAAMPYFRRRLEVALQLLELDPASVAAAYTYSEGLQQLTCRVVDQARTSQPPGPSRFETRRLAEITDLTARTVEAGRRLETLIPDEVRASHVLVRALAGMSNFYRELARVEEARPYAEEALARAQRLFEQDHNGPVAVWCMLHALDELWMIHTAAAEHDRACGCAERQIAVIEQTPDAGRGQSDFAAALLQAQQRRDDATAQALTARRGRE